MAVKSVYVGNISYEMTNEDLRSAFSRSGSVISAKIMIDRETGQPRGFGFVEFSSEDQVNQAIDDWNGRELCGRPLVVNAARERTFPPGNNGNGAYRGGNYVGGYAESPRLPGYTEGRNFRNETHRGGRRDYD